MYFIWVSSVFISFLNRNGWLTCKKWNHLSNVFLKGLKYLRVFLFIFLRKLESIGKEKEEDISKELQTLAQELSITEGSPQEIIQAACR